MTATLAHALTSIRSRHVRFVYRRWRTYGDRGQDRCSVGIPYTGDRRILQLTEDELNELGKTLVSEQRIGFEVKRNRPGDVRLRHGCFLQAATLHILTEGLTSSIKRRNNLAETDGEGHKRIVVTTLDGLGQLNEKGFNVRRSRSAVRCSHGCHDLLDGQDDNVMLRIP